MGVLDLEKKNKTVLWFLLMITEVFLLLNSPVTCAPASLTPGDHSFYASLYQNAPNNKNCSILPKVKQEDVARSQIDELCHDLGNTNKQQKVKNLPPTVALCIALQDLFPRVCALSANTNNATVLTAVDLNEANNLKLSNVCEDLNNHIKLIEQQTKNVAETEKDMQGKWLSPFLLTESGVNEKIECSSACSSSSKGTASVTGSNEVNPACVLLLQGYKIYRNVTSKSNHTNQPITVTHNSIAPDNVDSSKASISNSNPKKMDEHVAESQSALSAGSANTKGIEQTSEVDKTLDITTNAGNLLNPNEKVPSEGGNINSISKPVNDKDDVGTQHELTLSSIPKDQPADAAKGDNGALKTDLNSADAIGKRKKEGEKLPNSKKASSTTVASIDTAINNINDLVTPPIENGVPVEKGSSSSPVPNMNEPKENSNLNIKDQKSVSENTGQEDFQEATAMDNLKPQEDPTSKKSVSKGAPVSQKNKVDDDTDALAGLGDDDNLNHITDLNTNKVAKPETDNPETELEEPSVAENYDGEATYKTQKTRFGDRLSDNGDLRFQGTTINVSLNESEDTGFFSYFLFCVTLVGLLYFVVHNKKKLIAFVVEGKRPRSRSRRSSNASGQYRRLENNFD